MGVCKAGAVQAVRKWVGSSPLPARESLVLAISHFHLTVFSWVGIVNSLHLPLGGMGHMIGNYLALY